MISQCSYGCTPPCHDSLHSGPPAPLSPIALDFEAAERETACGSKLMVEMAVSGVRFHLNAQLRALVARVAQEEREKCAKELEAKAEEVFDEPIAHHDLYRLGLSDGYAEAIAFLRGERD